MDFYLVLLAGLIGLGAYVHFTCVRALGAKEEDNAVRLHPASSAPAAPISPPLLLVVLGWGGATRKQLRRIVEHCTDTLGCPVISYTSPMLQFLHGELHEPSIEQILQQIDEQLLPTASSSSGSLKPRDHHVAVAAAAATLPSGFAFFIHSNNGSFVYGELKNRMQDPLSPYYPLRLKLRGVILDSAPAISEANRGASAPNALMRLYNLLHEAVAFTFPSVAIVLNRSEYVHWFWTPAIAAWVVTFKTVSALWTHWTADEATIAANRAASAVPGSTHRKKKDGTEGHVRQMLAERLRNDVPVVPHLFLYSSADKLLPAHYIESYIAFLRTAFAAIPIKTYDFKTTGHVQHFLRETATYAAQLQTFLQSLQQAAQVKRTLGAAQGRA